MENRKLLKRGRRGRVFRIARPAGGNTLERRTTPWVVPGRRTRGGRMGGKCEIDGGHEFIEYWIDEWGIFSSPPLRVCVRATGSSRYPRLVVPAVVARSLEKLEIWDRYHPASILSIPTVKICHRHSVVVLRREKKGEKNLYRWRRRFTCILSGEGEDEVFFYKDTRGQLFPRRRLIVASIKRGGW